MQMTGLRCEYLARCAGHFLRSHVIASGGGGGSGSSGSRRQQEETQTNKEADASLANQLLVLMYSEKGPSFH